MTTNKMFMTSKLTFTTFRHAFQIGQSIFIAKGPLGAIMKRGKQMIHSCFDSNYFESNYNYNLKAIKPYRES